MSPRFRSASTMVRRPPRFGTSCHIRWLDFVMSIGFTRKNVATYSTLPLAFLVARRISVITRLRGSSGSSSPNARPASVSYWPALPKTLPSNAGETFLSMTMRLTSAWAAELQTRSRRPIETNLISPPYEPAEAGPTTEADLKVRLYQFWYVKADLQVRRHEFCVRRGGPSGPP